MSKVVINHSRSADLEYDPNRTYSKGQIVTVGGKPYLAEKDGITGPINPDDWGAMQDVHVYEKGFLASDWVDQGNGYSTLIIPYSLHKEDSPEIEITEGGQVVEVDTVEYAAGGDITLTIVTEAVFAGRYHIS